MKILKRILLVVAGIVLLLSIIGLLLPSKSHVERSVVVKAPIETVFNQVNTLANWKKWSPWYKLDTAAAITYNNTPAGNGASYSWESKNKEVGAGTLTLSDVKPNEHITQNMKFRDWGEGKAEMNFAPEGNGVKVTWTMDSDYGWNIFFRYIGVFMQSQLEKTFDQGLADLKYVAEHEPVVAENGAAYKVQVVDNINIVALSVYKKGTEQTISQMLGDGYAEVQAFMAKNKLKQMGAPFAVIPVFNMKGAVELEAAIPIEKAVPVSGNIKLLEVKHPHALKVDYYGDYAGSGAAHDAIDKWAKANNRKISSAPWEVYVTDPMVEKDTTKWLTEILYPVE